MDATLRGSPDSLTGFDGGAALVLGLAENQQGELHLTPYAHNVTSGGGKPGQGYPAMISFSYKDDGGDAGEGVVPTRSVGTSWDVEQKGGAGNAAVTYRTPGVLTTTVRRLTPKECERLQGFPDDWTLVPYRGRLAADGPRYKVIGNSMAVPVMRWIGTRIALVEAHHNGT